ncbi:enhancer of mRNA-decapping protein 4 [Dioscorea alata]|uniref:Enhancer of mRNA-decapping protein 4 n=2 Tax=Dioscorea alata TaxID=55571 RepID=A0ACB7WMF8_DIOAL|nr:enhancer of mRNA-decapping protein 4 [Dioscorea alata]KAH7689100.1 enhancer of mRNA-decapping protein 4 [Dioscorea alata]
MASPAGNPNNPAPFDVNKLFKPPTNPSPNPTAASSPFAPPPLSYNSPATVYPPPPHGAFSYPPPTPPFHNHPFLHYAQDPLPRPNLPFAPPANPNTNPNQNSGARIMALLVSSPPLESAVSMPLAPPSEPPILHAIPSAPPAVTAVAQPPPARKPSSKMPRGRHLGGRDRAVYDVDSRLPGESQPPQLEVTPITKYASDPGLVLGRQIAVNRTYICYGLKLGAIRVLNINTALRSLLRGHTQRVTDMAFFAEDVHFLASASIDGRVFVWKINEGPDDEDKPLITGKIIIALQIVGDEESYHPRICWHSHKQEILIIGIGNSVLKIDTTKVGRGKEFSAEEPLRSPMDKLIDGVQLIGKHDGEVTDLSISQWMMTRLVSASKDGTVKIWDDRRMMPLVTLRPHDGQPVNCVAFLTASHRPDHIVLITAGPLNREVKIWASTGEEGWLLSSDSESWHCIQTLELRSSSEPRLEEAFFNQVVVLPHSNLLLLANAKKNAIYAVHIDYGSCPAATRMDYIADFTVAMPILSLTGTRDFFSDVEQMVQVYCVQTQAIQQYALDLSQCLPPTIDNMGLGKESSLPNVSDTSISEGFVVVEPTRGLTVSDLPVGGGLSGLPLSVSNSEAALHPVTSDASESSNAYDSTFSNVECKPSAPPLPSCDAEALHAVSSPIALHVGNAGRQVNLMSPPKGLERTPSAGDRNVDNSILPVERKADTASSNVTDVSCVDDNLGKIDIKGSPGDVSVVANSLSTSKINDGTHLITPSEILSGATSLAENTLVTQDLKVEEVKIQEVIVNKDMESLKLGVKDIVETGTSQPGEFYIESPVLVEVSGKSASSQTLEAKIETDKECSTLRTETNSLEVQSHLVDDVAVIEALEQSSNIGDEGIQESTKDMAVRTSEASPDTPSQSLSATKGKKQKGKQSQSSIPSPSSSPFNSMDSFDEQGIVSSAPSIDAAVSQIQSLQDSINQLMIMQKEMQKQISTVVAVPINKECKRVETALGRSIEKVVKANTDALWARFQEENSKHEKVERDRVQQLTNLISNCMNKDLPAILERALKKEISAIGPVLARTITPFIEKTISSAIADSFQRGVGDKAVNQLDKSISSKLEAQVARQIQTQFQTSGKQALQDALRLTMESSVIPAFEHSCKSVFEQVDTAFQKGMAEHTVAAQQQFESAHTPLALTLRDAINSASSMTHNLSTELADGHRKLLALTTAGNSKTPNPMGIQQTNGPGIVPEMNIQPVVEDPTKELTRWISDRKYEEAFTFALQRSDVTIVSWLCSQVDIRAICSMVPPLSQGVLLALLQQLTYDVANDTSRKLQWITEVASAINPTDPLIAMHVRPIFEQVYNTMAHQRSLPTSNSADASCIRLIMHVINSVLIGCK